MGNRFNTVEEVIVCEARGPWTTKSGGELTVLSALPFSTTIDQFFNYKEKELAKMPKGFDIRGLRIYSVRNLSAHQIGGMEFHKIRQEMIFCLEGSVRWECEDVFGNKKNWMLTPGIGVWMPPYILHTYKVLEEKSGLLVVCNTLFIPEDKRTHDTYSKEEFLKIQKQRFI